MFFDRKTISVIQKNIRNLSSGVFRIPMHRDISEEFCDLVVKSCKPLELEDAEIRPFSRKSGERAAETLKGLIKKHEPLDKAFKQVRAENAVASIVTGIELPDITFVPKSAMDLQARSFKAMFRPMEIISYSYARLLGIDPQNYMGSNIVTPIYVDEGSKDHPNSYKSAQTLPFHNDGWGEYGAIPKVLLLGWQGHNEAVTELISFEQIRDHFKKSGKQNLWKVLCEENYTQGEIIPVPIRIFDEKEKKINYAQYANLLPRGSDYQSFDEAISFLNETLETLTPLVSESIQRGEAHSYDNEGSLHRKKMLSVPKTTSQEVTGERLAARVHGDKEPSK